MEDWIAKAAQEIADDHDVQPHPNGDIDPKRVAEIIRAAMAAAMIQFSLASVLFQANHDTEPEADVLTNRLRRYADLPEGWSFGDGVPVADSAIKSGTEILKWASQLMLRADVFPGLSGECMIAFYRGEDVVRVIVYPDDKTTFGLRVERGHGPGFVNVVEPAENQTRHDVFRHVLRLLENDEHS